MVFDPEAVQRFSVHDSEIMHASMAGDDYTIMVPAVDYDDLLNLYTKLRSGFSGDDIRNAPGMVQTCLMTVEEANALLKNLGVSE